MKFMILVPANADSETGRLPTEQELETMGKFNEEMVKAGIMLAGEGLYPTSKGSRVIFGSGGKTEVKDGPFTESKELVAGFWIIQVKSKEEALAWMRRAPFPEGTALEVRQIYAPEDFAASDPTGKLRKEEDELRAQIAKQHHS